MVQGGGDCRSLKDAADALCRGGQFADAVPLYSRALQEAAAAEPHLRSTLLANRCLTLLKAGQPGAALQDAEQARPSLCGL